MIDVADGRRDGALADGGDPPCHLFRGHPTIGPDDADDWNVHNREDIDRSAVDRHNAQNQNGERHDYERVRLPKRQFNNPHIPLARRLTLFNLNDAISALRHTYDPTAAG